MERVSVQCAGEDLNLHDPIGSQALEIVLRVRVGQIRLDPVV
jgi:hypothetical protein